MLYSQNIDYGPYSEKELFHFLQCVKNSASVMFSVISTPSYILSLWKYIQGRVFNQVITVDYCIR